MTTDLLASPDSVNAPIAESRFDIPEQILEKARAEIGTDVDLYSPEQIGLPEQMGDGGTLSVVGEVSLKGDGINSVDLALIKCVDLDGSESVYVAGLEADEQGRVKAVSNERWQLLEDNTTFSIGRAKPTNNFMDDGRQLFGHMFTDDISRNHIGITLNKDTLTIVDTSSNGSTYRGVDTEAKPEAESYDYDANHTITAEEGARLRMQLKLDKEKGVELFQGRPTINRDTFPIDGHVDIRSWIAGDEAIVVDSEKYPKEFEKLRASFNRNLQDTTVTAAVLSETDVLKAIS